MRGDYGRAVEILKPAAERWQMPYDNTAAFFMALMYDNGLGVAPDPVKACALTLRTLNSPRSRGELTLTIAVQAMVDDFNTRLGPEQMGRCMLLTDIGFDRTEQTATFTLAAGHWISVELSPERRAAMAHIDTSGKQNDLELGAAERRERPIPALHRHRAAPRCARARSHGFSSRRSCSCRRRRASGR